MLTGCPIPWMFLHVVRAGTGFCWGDTMRGNSIRRRASFMRTEWFKNGVLLDVDMFVIIGFLGRVKG
jgi:hypothetical protein